MNTVNWSSCEKTMGCSFTLWRSRRGRQRREGDGGEGGREDGRTTMKEGEPIKTGDNHEAHGGGEEGGIGRGGAGGGEKIVTESW